MPAGVDVFEQVPIRAGRDGRFERLVLAVQSVEVGAGREKLSIGFDEIPKRHEKTPPSG